jgi:type 1 glutamine amidotransferase
VVFHCSLHSYRSVPDGQDFWREMLGVTSHRHTRAHEIPVKWSDDPITRDLPAFTTPVDELYVIEKSWPGTKAIATAVNDVDQGVAGAAGTISNDVYPVVWSHEFTADRGGARTFGTSLGHSNDVWNTPQFQELVIRGFRWALRKDPFAPWPTAPPAASGPGRIGRGGA